MSKSYSSGVITIPSVTGDIVISGTAVKNAPSYTNQLEDAINMSGTKIGKQWMYTNKRYNSSSGEPVDNSGTNITGLIPCTAGDIIDMRFESTTDLVYNNIKCFKADRTECAAGNLSFNNIINNTNIGTSVSGNPAKGNLRFALTGSVSGNKDMAYIAFCTTSKNIDNVIIAVREAIDDTPPAA